MFELFIGDIYQSLADEATAYNADAVLITSLNVDSFLKTPPKTAYSSIGDIVDSDVFFQLCSRANKIYYRPPIKWSDEHAGNKSKKITETILAGLSQHIPIDGIQKIIDQKSVFNNDFLEDHRKTNLPQLWFTGCSITYGIGVSKDQTFREIIAQELKLEHSNLSHPGSSIIWQSDQICRADIKHNDIVFWGLTSQHRLPVFDPEVHAELALTKPVSLALLEWEQSQADRNIEPAIIHLISGIYKRKPDLKSKFPIDLIDNTTLTYHNILAVRRAYNFCKKIGAQLVILGLMRDVDKIYLYYDVPVFKESISCTKKHLDLGTDALHPGPQTHQMFANEFLEFYSKLYPANIVAKI